MATIYEVESNNSLAQAQSIPNSSNWTTEYNAVFNDRNLNNISSFPHVNVKGSGDGSMDYYKVNLPNAGTIVLDIDNADWDTTLRLYNSSGGLIAENDDWTYDAGSSNRYNSFIQSGGSFIQESLAAGDYYIEVGQYSGGWGSWVGIINSGLTYDLNITRYDGQVFGRPTLTNFAGPISNGYEDGGAIQVTFANLQNQGDEADSDGAVSAFVVKNVSNGSLTINGSTWNATSNNVIDGSHTALWTPALNVNGVQNAFTVVARDNLGLESVTAIQAKISVTAVNDAPFAIADAAIVTNEDTVATGNVLANDMDVDSASLRAIAVNQPQHGTLVLANNGSYTYTPTSNYNGTDSFSYKANDGQLDSNVITVSVSVNAVNDAPVAVADAAIVTNEDTVATGNVLTNDTDVDSASLRAIAVTQPQHGTLVLANNGSYTYTPTSNYNGTDSFSYKANDGQLDSNAITVNLSVNAVNDTPVAVADSVQTDEDNTVVVDVLANDSDTDGDALTTVLVDAPQKGSVAWANGRFEYTPQSNFNGTDSFTYQVNDGQANSETVTVGLTINAVDDAAIAIADVVNVDEDASITLNFPELLNNDTDVDGDSATITAIDTTGLKGSASIDTETGTITYVADADEFDLLATNATVVDTFSYTMQDSNGSTASATISVTVKGIADTITTKGTSKADTFTGANGEDVLSGNAGNDILSGGNGADTLDGGNGKDTLNGGNGADALSGGNDNDELSGGDGADTLLGGNGIDTLNGGNGNDVLNGNAGNDLITGAVGDDMLTGSTGADTFIFAANSGKDKIADFNVIHGDKIQLSSIAGMSDWAAVSTKLSYSDQETHIDLGNGNEIVLTGVALADLSESAFIF